MTELVELKDVLKIIEDKTGAPDDEIILKATFVDDLGADSLEMVMLVMTVEEEFDIDIDDDVARNITQVFDLVNCINNKGELPNPSGEGKRAYDSFEKSFYV